MNVVTVVMFFGGITLVYSAVKDIPPQDVLKSVIKGETPRAQTQWETPPIPGAKPLTGEQMRRNLRRDGTVLGPGSPNEFSDDLGGLLGLDDGPEVYPGRPGYQP